MAKFLKARTVHRSYHHITREVVESGMEEEHLRREVERLEGIFLTALFFSTKMGCLVQPQNSSVFVSFKVIILYLASLKLSGGGWVVEKYDFNENPVVSLDLDFGLRLKVCQNKIINI